MVIHHTTHWDKPKRFAAIPCLKTPAASALLSFSKDKEIHIRAQLYFIHCTLVGKFWSGNQQHLPKRKKYALKLNNLLL